MISFALSRIYRFLVWLRPNAEALRALPWALAISASFFAIAHFATNRIVSCDHYPDEVNKRGVRHYECQSPQWQVECSTVIRNDLTDVCFKRFGPGATLVQHNKALHDYDCQAEKGPLAYALGSEGCGCLGIEDRDGHCVAIETYCQSLYGPEAYLDVTPSPEMGVHTLAADEAHSQFVVCRCADGMVYDEETSKCL